MGKAEPDVGGGSGKGDRPSINASRRAKHSYRRIVPPNSIAPVPYLAYADFIFE